MTDNPIDIGRAAVAAALARAGKRASTAAAVAAFVPLAMVATATPADAITAVCTVCVAAIVTPDGSNFDYTYNFSATSGQVVRIELPEIQAGEFLTGSGGSFLGSIPTGWTVGQQTKSAFVGSGGATFKAPNGALTPAAYIELVWVNLGGGEGFLGSGSPQTFTLESSTGNTIASNAGIATASGGSFTIDPPTPNPAPEPGTLALIGTAIAGLAGFRRRKKV